MTVLGSVRYWGMEKDKSKPVAFVSRIHPSYEYHLKHKGSDVYMCDHLELVDGDEPMLVVAEQHNYHLRKIERMVLDGELCDHFVEIADMPPTWVDPYTTKTVTATGHSDRKAIREPVEVPKELIK